MRFEAPETVDAAVALLAGEAGTAYPLSGGTDLLVQMRSGRIAPDLVVDTKRIAALREIAREGGGWRVGAAVSGAEINEHAGLMADWPGLAEAANLVGSTQVAGRATLAGNLCTASPAADTVPAMAAAGALARIAGPEGRREIPVEDVPTGVQKNALAKGEMIEAIVMPERAARSADCYLRFIPRTEMDIAVVGCAVNLSLATRIKHRHGIPARTRDRVAIVLKNARTNATKAGFDPDFAERIWSELIEWSIAREQDVLGENA